MAAHPGRLGRYRIVSELGRGAMGVVYRGVDPELDRSVAVKTIRMSSDSDEMAEYLARFRQEAKALAGLNHAGIITVYDTGHEGEVAYMAMELLEGVELRELLGKSRMQVATAIDLAAQVADALAFAHEHGIVHRDIKPANIMVLPGNRAKLMDFGIARMRASDVKTQTGVLLGSPKYMSPEQILGRPVDHRSDIFSLGVVIYEMLAGATPFSGADLTQLMYQVLNVNPPAPGRLNPGVPELVDLTVAKALEKSLERRYQAAAQLASDLRLCLEAVNDATRRLDRRDFQGETWPLDDAGGTAAGDAAERTVRLEPAAHAPTMKLAAQDAPPVAAHAVLVPSPRFASSEAISRLTRPSASDRSRLGPGGPAVGAVERYGRDRDLMLAAAGVALAAVVASWIVFQ